MDIHIRPSGEFSDVANSPEGIGSLKDRLVPLAPEKVVTEATGGFESLATDIPGKSGLPVIVINAARIRGFATAVGRFAKTDPIDAEIIALFAETVCPDHRKLPDEKTRELSELTNRRCQLMKMRTAEKNRLTVSGGPARD
ncbi:IS110 family transposase [Desulfonema ishimotonii]|uniref:IS110 family transposase n=1 Tax=Desulfonema ishimotonii TaxID=45657 RepID=A0A401FZ52_9BACT|nr:IS110 family transposase [Desulfonema ishimotonii]